MAPQVSYPGVYIQEVSSGVRTITGVATSITAFLGRTVKGPLNHPVRCLSYADFLRAFGGAPSGAELATSVKQFYDNGGSDCYVVRLAQNARKAAVTIQNPAGTDVLVASAKVEGVWGNGLRLEVDYNTTAPGDSFNLDVIQEEGGQVVATERHTNVSMDFTSPRFAPTFVTRSSELIDLMLDPTAMGNASDAGSNYRTSTAAFNGFSEARRPLSAGGDGLDVVATSLDALLPTNHNFEISVDHSAYVPVNLSTVAALTAGNVIAEVQAAINNALAILSPAPTVTVSFDDAGFGRLLRITADSGNVANVCVRRAASNDFASAMMLGSDYGGLELTRWQSLRPAPTGSTIAVGTSAMGLENVNTMAALAQSAITGITIGSDPAIPLNLVTTTGTDPWMIDSISTSVSANNDGIREKLQRIVDAINTAPGGSYSAALEGYQIAIVANSGTFNAVPAGINITGAGLPAFTINTRQYKLGHDGSSASATGGSFDPNSTTFNPAEDGDDGTAPNYATYVGNPNDQIGFHSLDTVDLFNLMVLPRDEEVSETDRFNIWGPASIYCQSRRAFLLIDAPDNWVSSQGKAAVVQTTSLINDLRATVVKDHSAVFYPKVIANVNGIPTPVSSSGAIAGLMARTDATRGVWKAPAGIEADIRGIAGIQVKLTDLENGTLNKLGVNCARAFPSGYVNWGARTMDGADDIGSEWKYIPIRRLALFLAESLQRGSQWVVFEPNDEPLWANIRLNLGAFMNGLFRQGAFQGSTPDEAFYVKCDSETTTQADRNLGIVNIEVGFAPLKPAEFVVIKIQQIAGDLA